MGVSNIQVLGSISGGAGDAIFSSWRGIPYVRSKPQSFTYKDSLEQRLQSFRFETLKYLGNMFNRPWMNVFWNPLHQNKTAVNLFMKAQEIEYKFGAVLGWEEPLMAKGIMKPPGGTVGSDGNPIRTYTFRNSVGDPLAKPTDQIWVISWDYIDFKVVFNGFTGSYRGTGETANFTIPITLYSQATYAIAYYQSPRVFSSSTHFPAESYFRYGISGQLSWLLKWAMKMGFVPDYLFPQRTPSAQRALLVTYINNAFI